MHKFRRDAGFTLIEMMTVVAIVGIMSVVGFAALKGYARHEDTRRAALAVANVLSKARSEAMSSGRMTFVLFAEPTDGSVTFATGQWAALVIDQNDDKKVGVEDAVTAVFLPNGISPEVSSYGAHGLNAMKTTALPAADESAAVVDGDLTALTDGTTIPVDADLGVPAIAFSAQGSPVTISPPPAAPAPWGSGAGGVYLTDNDKMVLAVLVLPLGDVRTMAFDSGSGEWK